MPQNYAFRIARFYPFYSQLNKLFQAMRHTVNDAKKILFNFLRRHKASEETLEHNLMHKADSGACEQISVSLFFDFFLHPQMKKIVFPQQRMSYVKSFSQIFPMRVCEVWIQVKLFFLAIFFHSNYKTTFADLNDSTSILKIIKVGISCSSQTKFLCFLLETVLVAQSGRDAAF